MRAVLMLVLVAVLPAVAVAQLPADLGGLTRKLPSLDGFLRGTPLTTSFDDTARQLPVLDRKPVGRPARPLRSLARTASGGFILQPGLWEGTFESYCLRTATHAPGKGDGFLLAPIKGSRASAWRTGAANRPNNCVRSVGISSAEPMSPTRRSNGSRC